MQLKPLLQAFFFGNYFYGICAVVLSVETALQQHYPLNELPYYGLIFLLTIAYYTKAYDTDTATSGKDERSVWYSRHRPAIRLSQWLFICFSIAITGYMACSYLYRWPDAKELILLAVFPLIAGLYYGVENAYFKGFNLRNTGWLKPFVIGFVWSGWVTVYPLLFADLIHRPAYAMPPSAGLLFLNNMMFITVLSIMFDIKDYAMDSNRQLKTFVVLTGLRKTIFTILLPLSIMGLGSFAAYALLHDFTPLKMLLNGIPFILLTLLAYSLYRRRPILYYLILIDGLMLVKGLCGIWSTYY